jgi:predicted LPLAT superfamily acyltransferase
LLLAAHLGNWEAAGQMIGRLGVPVNVTGLDKESPAVRALLNSSPEQKFKLIPLTGSPTDAIELVAALRRGEIVAMLGDRLYGGPSARVPFLGGQASFPVGPYVMAASAGAPLIQVFSLREPGGHYHFFGFPALPPVRPPRHERDAHLRECAAQFAARLGSLVQRDPLQWYNFFPFWDEPAKQPSPTLASADAPLPTQPEAARPQ